MNLRQFMQDFALPAEFQDSAERCFFPLANWLNEELKSSDSTPFLLGINGAQGTGKSTLAELLKRELAEAHNKHVEILSIDDLYLTKAERLRLSESVHPLLRTRGVPGTHDVALGLTLVQQLRSLEPEQSINLPRFNKAIDDRYPESEWTSVKAPLDMLILEGWCVGSTAIPEEDLAAPINELEARQDSDCHWRNYVNEQLKRRYDELFDQLDRLVFLKAPSFDAIFHWRLEQEQKLERQTQSEPTDVMTAQEIRSFIQHYERITRQNLKVLPGTADALIELNERHEAISLRIQKSA